MLTGLYSHTTGAVSNVEGKIPARFPLVSDLLQQAGYETAFLGKSHIEGALMEHNWDYYFGFVGQADYYRPRITEGVRGKYGPEKLYEGEYVDTLLTRKAVEWLGQKRSKPFCMFLWFYAPHAPFYRPKDMVNDFNGVAIPKPDTFDEDLKGYPGKPRAVADADDKCPDEPGPIDRDGCPVAQIQNGRIVIAEQIKFRTGSAELDPASDPILAAVGDILLKHPELTQIRVEGHTDNQGVAKMNVQLSKDRAAAVAKWLTNHNIDASRLQSSGFGASQPISSNATPDGRRENRRVEFHIVEGTHASR